MVDFKIRVIIDPSQATRGTKQVTNQLDKVNRSADKLRSGLRSAFAPLLGIAGAAVVIRTLSTFEQEIAAVGAISGASAKELEQFRDVAISLGTNTRFSATQAAEGLTFLARAGFTASESLEAIEGTLKLAQAGQLGLGQAADIASNVLQGFRLEVDQTARVVDILAASANSSNTTVSQLGQALSFVAPIAAGVGVTIEETTAAISALSNAGLQASRAGTGLTRVIAELESPAKRSQEILGQLGLSADDVQVSQVGLTVALQRLAAAGVTTADALEIFGQRGGPAFEVLANSTKDVERFNKQFQNSAGTADELADALDDNLQGSLLALRSAFQGVILQAGEAGATGALRGLVDATTSVLRGVADNIELFRAGVIGVSVALTANFLPGLVASTIGLTTFTTGIGFGTAATAKFSAVLRASPLAFFAGGLALVASQAIKVADELKSIQEELLGIQEQGANFALTDFAKANGALIRAQTQLSVTQKEVNRDIAAGKEPTEALTSLLQQQTDTVDLLTNRVDLFKNGLASTAEEADKVAAALDRQAMSVDSVLAALEAENNLLLANSREREVQIRLRSELAALEEESGQRVSPEQAAVVELLIRENLALQDQSAILDEVNASALEYRLTTEALNDLLDVGLITQEEYNARIAALDETLDGVATSGDAASVSLSRVNEVSREGAGFALNLATGLTQVALAGAQAAMQAQSVARGVALAIGPVQQFAQGQTDLDAALQAGALSTDQYTIATNNLLIASTAAGNDLGAGLAAGLAQVENKILDTSGLVENALVGAFDGAEDALVSFLTTGEADFGAFVDSLLADIARLLARQALIGLLGLGGGSGAIGFLSSTFAGGKAEGGPVSPNKTFLVGEEGPELFTPPSAGNIMTASDTANLMGGGGGGESQQTVVTAPPVNVSVVNVMDPEQATAALSSASGEQAILNVIRRNSSAVNNSLSG